MEVVLFVASAEEVSLLSWTSHRFIYSLRERTRKAHGNKVLDRDSWKMLDRGQNCFTHCACHCKVNSPGYLLVTEALICSAGCLGGVYHTGDTFACQVACGENRNVFCLGMGGRSAKAMRPAPWNQSSTCTLGNSLILSLTHGKKWKSLGISSKDRMELICKIILTHDENWEKHLFFSSQTFVVVLIFNSLYTFMYYIAIHS